ncbi:subtilisin-like protein [Colletotrichum eremochloae]|nr:subtilisin-like protein [Colletotrichum eremochloae]
MHLETVIYGLLLSLAHAQNNGVPRSPSFPSHSFKANSTFTSSVTQNSNQSVQSTTLSKTSFNPTSTTSSTASTTIVPKGPPTTTPPSSSLTTSIAPPLTTSVSDGKTIAIALGIAGSVVVIGGVGGGFVVFGSGAPVAIAAGSVVQLRPDNNVDDGNDEPEIKTLTTAPLSTADLTTTTIITTTSSTTTTTTTTSTTTTSSTPTQTPAEYVVFLKPDIAADSSQKADFETFLTPFAQSGTLKDLAQVFNSNEQIGIYVLVTTEDNALEISKDSRVSSSIDLNVEAGFDEPSSPVQGQQDEFTREAFGDVIIQSPSQNALIDLSLPLPVNADGFTPLDIPGYAFGQEAGKGVTVYIMDTGTNPSHDEYTKAEGTIRWLFATEDKTENDEDGHGSCMQSLVNGPLFGAAKSADIVMVKLGARYALDNILFGLLLIYDDVIKNKLQGKAVINMSLGNKLLLPSSNTRGRKPGFILEDGIAGYKSALELLVEEDVVAVTASGNSREDPNGGEFVTSFPAFLGREMDIITVGAVDERGKREVYSQGVPRELDTSAIGTATCASNNGNNDVEKHGTSISTPLVSGMIAVWLSQAKYRQRLQVPGKVAANVKKLVRELSYNRFGGGDTPVAWNGEDVFTCQAGPGRLRARAGSCAVNSTSSALPAPTQTPVPTPTEPPVATTEVTTTVPAVVPSTAPPPPAALPPVPCYNFNINAYGYCCPDANNPCKPGVGTCYLPFRGEGVGGGGDGQTLVPTGARCPPPPGATDNW